MESIIIKAETNKVENIKTLELREINKPIVWGKIENHLLTKSQRTNIINKK
jgi:hypothetical protein